MSIPMGFAHAFRNDAASNAMGVAAYPLDAGGLEFRQSAGPRLTEDPQGQSIATFGAMIDTCLGSAVFQDPEEDRFFVMSRISLSVGAPIPTRGEVTATSRFHHFDEQRGFGLTTATLRDPDATLAHVTCRAVAVDPPFVLDPVIGTGSPEVGNLSPAASHPEQLVSLGVTIGYSRHDPQTFVGEWTPTEWMLNFRGTVQGGVVVAVASFIAEAVGVELGSRNPAPLADIDVSILRSALPRCTYRVTTRVVRRGRRLTVLHITISDENSTSMVVSTAHLGSL